MADDGGRTEHQELAKPFVSGPADATPALLAAGRMLLRCEPEPSCKMPPGPELAGIDPEREVEGAEQSDTGDLRQTPALRVGPVLRRQRLVDRGQPPLDLVDLPTELLQSIDRCRWQPIAGDDLGSQLCQAFVAFCRD